MRRAACSRRSLQLRTALGAGSAPVAVGVTRPPGLVGDDVGAGLEHAARSARTAMAERLVVDSMQGTVDLLGQFTRHAVDGRQILNARTRDAAHAAEAL